MIFCVLHKIYDELFLDNLNEVIFIAPSNEKLIIVSDFCEQLFCSNGLKPRIIRSNTINENVIDADIFFNISRSGGLNARHLDETLPLPYNVLGHESQGFGGFSSALRNIAILLQIKDKLQFYCPNTLFVNISNPSGIITESARRLGLNAIGICDVPFAMKEKISNYLGYETSKIGIDYVGLNHLSWITELTYCGSSILDNVLDTCIDEVMCKIRQSNIPDMKINSSFLRAIRAIPSSYLFYYYCRNKTISYLQKQEQSRAQIVMIDNKRIFDYYTKKETATLLQDFGDERGAHYLGKAVWNFVSDYYNGKGKHIVCIPNGNCLPFLPRDKVIETKVNIENGNMIPVLSGYEPNGHFKSLITAVSEYERLTVEAGLSGNVEIAFQALASHPLIPTIDIAAKLLAIIKENFRELLPQFSW